MVMVQPQIEIKEIWKDVVGYEGLYRVSNWGRIKSLYNYKGTNERILAPTSMRTGHLQVNLCKNKIKKHHLVHRLMTRAFVGPCPEGMECCHNDGNPTNNYISNIRYDTHKSNSNDMTIHGTSCARKTPPKGSSNGFSKLTENNVIEINTLLNEGELVQREIAEIFNVSRSTITLIHNKKTWRHVDV